MDNDFNSLSTEEVGIFGVLMAGLVKKLQFSMYKHVSDICDEVGTTNTLLGEFTVSPEAKEMITELIWTKIALYTSDIEAFADHAKRNSVAPEDARLIFRRLPNIIEEIDKIDDTETSNQKKRKRKKDTDDVEEVN